MSKINLRLEFEVEYDPTGNDDDPDDSASKEELADLLAMIAYNAMSNGMVTGETPATVENSHLRQRP